MLSENGENSVVKIQDKKKKYQRKIYADARRHTITHDFEIGDRVLCKQMKRNCLTPYYDLDPFVITDIGGKKITAKRRAEFIQRNSLFFKKMKANGADSSRSSDYPPISFGKTYIKYQDGNHPHTLEIEE
ncbi:hypothetical protein JTB14_001395 [Gonioctena quinquepunctata]|nr:hypothetical protein JTB14_001395 [Gonioctena quinquepunctata]